MRSDRQVLFWLAALIVAAIAILVLKAVLLPFVVGLVIAYALNPLTERLVRIGLSRMQASGAVVALAITILVLALFFLVPVLIHQAQQLILSLPTEIDRVKELIESYARDRLGDRFAQFKTGLDHTMRDLSVNWSALATSVLHSVWSQGSAIVNFVSLLLITPIVVFYMLVDWHPMLAKVDSWLPRNHAGTIRRLAGEIDSAISAFIRGQGTVCLILGVLYAAGLTLAGVRYGLLIGLATGVLSFVPFAGWALGLIISTIVALAQFWPDLMPIYKVIAVFVVGMALDSALLSPRIVGSSIGLHPVWLIFALFVFSYLFGFVGMLVAVPLAAAIAVLIRFALQVYLRSTVYQGSAGGGTPGTPLGS